MGRNKKNKKKTDANNGKNDSGSDLDEYLNQIKVEEEKKEDPISADLKSTQPTSSSSQVISPHEENDKKVDPSDSAQSQLENGGGNTAKNQKKKEKKKKNKGKKEMIQRIRERNRSRIKCPKDLEEEGYITAINDLRFANYNRDSLYYRQPGRYPSSEQNDEETSE